MPELSRLKFSANNFVLSDADDNTSRPLNRGGIAESLKLEISHLKKENQNLIHENRNWKQ